MSWPTVTLQRRRHPPVDPRNKPVNPPDKNMVMVEVSIDGVIYHADVRLPKTHRKSRPTALYKQYEGDEFG